MKTPNAIQRIDLLFEQVAESTYRRLRFDISLRDWRELVEIQSQRALKLCRQFGVPTPQEVSNAQSALAYQATGLSTRSGEPRAKPPAVPHDQRRRKSDDGGDCASGVRAEASMASS